MVWPILESRNNRGKSPEAFSNCVGLPQFFPLVRLVGPVVSNSRLDLRDRPGRCAPEPAPGGHPRRAKLTRGSSVLREGARWLPSSRVGLHRCCLPIRRSSDVAQSPPPQLRNCEPSTVLPSRYSKIRSCPFDPREQIRNVSSCPDRGLCQTCCCRYGKMRSDVLFLEAVGNVHVSADVPYWALSTTTGQNRHHGHDLGPDHGVLRSRNQPGSRDRPRRPCHRSPNCILRCMRIRYADLRIGLGLHHSPTTGRLPSSSDEHEMVAPRLVE